MQRLEQTVDAYLLLFRGGGRLSLILQTEAMRPASSLAPLRERTLDRLSARSASAFSQRRGEAIEPLIFRGLFLALEGLLAYAYRDGEPSATQLAGVRRSILSIMTRTLEPNRK